MKSDSMVLSVCVWRSTRDGEKRGWVSRERRAGGKAQASAQVHSGTFYLFSSEAILLQEKWSKIDGVVLNGTNQRVKDGVNRLKLCMLNAAVKCF